MTKVLYALPRENFLSLGNSRLAVISFLYANYLQADFILISKNADPAFKGVLEAQLNSIGVQGEDTAGADRKMHSEIYQKAAQDLMERGFAYPCYCTTREIEARIGSPNAYDGRCRQLSLSDINQYIQDEKKPCIRFTASDKTDDASLPKRDDFIILNQDGTPAECLMNAVDIRDLGITHLLRDREAMADTGLESMILKRLGCENPVVIHVPSLIPLKDSPYRNLNDLLTAGFIPQAIFNYLINLGWENPDGRAILSPDAVKGLFHPKDIRSAAAVEDNQLLNWISRNYLINLDLESLYRLAVPFLEKQGLLIEDNFPAMDVKVFLEGFLNMVRGYCRCLSDFTDHLTYFVKEDYPIERQAEWILQKNENRKILDVFRSHIRNTGDTPDEACVAELISRTGKELSVRGRNLYMPLRAALTGKLEGPEITYLIPVIGKNRAFLRLDRVINLYS